MGRRGTELLIDLEALRDHHADDRAGQLARRRVRLDLRQLTLQDGRRRAQPEVGLEDRRERDAPAGAERPDPVGPSISCHVEP